MTDASHGDLAKLRVLIAEDDALCAMEMEQMVRELGCEIVETVSSVAQIHDTTADIDCALLDVNMRREWSYPAASALIRRGVRVIFVTGYGELPERPDELADVPRLRKPVTRSQLAAALAASS